MVFACLVADQDLLFVTYEVPCISICRAEQRAKALERLGMPPRVYQDIADRGGNAPVVTGAPPLPPSFNAEKQLFRFFVLRTSVVSGMMCTCR